VSADACFIDWINFQTRLALNCSYFFTDNEGSIQSVGVEVESNVKIADELTFPH